MCPPELAKHLSKEIKNLPQPEHIRSEISDWIARDDKNRTGGLLASLEDMYTQDDEWSVEEGQDDRLEDELKQSLGTGLYAAMVRKGAKAAKESASVGSVTQKIICSCIA